MLKARLQGTYDGRKRNIRDSIRLFLHIVGRRLQFANHICQMAHSARFEKDAKIEVDPISPLHFGQESNPHQGVSTEVEEVVIESHLIDA